MRRQKCSTLIDHDPKAAYILILHSRHSPLRQRPRSLALIPSSCCYPNRRPHISSKPNFPHFLSPAEYFAAAPWFPFERLSLTIDQLEKAPQDEAYAGVVGALVADMERWIKEVDVFFVKMARQLIKFNVLRLRPTVMNKMLLAFQGTASLSDLS